MMQPPPLPQRPLEYATPRRPGRGAWTSIPLTIALGVPTLVVYVFALVITPRMEMVFQDFKTELPGITNMTLAFTRWMANDFGWAILWLLPVTIPILLTLAGVVGRSAPVGSRRLRILTSANISLLLLLLVLLWMALALFMPMVALIQSVSSPKK